MQQHEDKLLIDGAMANAFLAVRSARLLASASQPSDGAALWIIAMLHTAAYSLLTAWLDNFQEHASYTADSVKRARGFDEFENPRVDADKLHLLPLGEVQKKVAEVAKVSGSLPFGPTAFAVMAEITHMRNWLQHPKPVARGVPHDLTKELVAFLIAYIGATLKKMPNVYFGAYHSTNTILAELKALVADFEARWGVIAWE